MPTHISLSITKCLVICQGNLIARIMILSKGPTVPQRMASQDFWLAEWMARVSSAACIVAERMIIVVCFNAKAYGCEGAEYKALLALNKRHQPFFSPEEEQNIEDSKDILL